MKVMHVEAGRHLYGGALQVYYLMRHLERKGVDNILVCPRHSAIAACASPLVRVEACAMRGDSDVLFTRRLIKLVRRHQPDLLHIHSRRGADVWGAIAARCTGTPGILTRRVDNRQWPLVARAQARCFARVIAISEGIRAVLLSEGVATEKVLTIRSAVDTHRFTASGGNDQVRARFGYSAEHLVLAVVAQLIKRKGHQYLFDIVPRIVEQFPRARLLIFGQGPCQRNLEDYARQKKISRWVQFAGFHGDMENILPSMDLIVHPALKEGLGVALLQAGACGVPVVASRVGGIPEIVRDGENGYLVPPAKPQALLDKILQLLGDEARRKQFGRRGREIVERDFSIECMARDNHEVYKSILSLHCPATDNISVE